MVLKEIRNRRSVREYKQDQIKDADILEIIKAAQFAPTSHNNRAVEFIVIKNQAIKDKLNEIIGSSQEFIKQAPVLIIPTSDCEKSGLIVQDLSLATSQIFLEATHLGLGCVWKNISPEMAGEIKKLLDIPKSFTLINIIPTGYPKNKIEPHLDSEFSSQKIHFEKF